MGSKAKTVAVRCLIMLLLAASTFAASPDDLRLIEAVKSRDRAAIRSLIEKRVDVNAAQPDGTTALAWAANRDDLETADFLIRAGANVRGRWNGGFTALLFASRQGDIPSARLLLAAGADINEATPKNGTALVVAAASGREDFSIFLLDKGANPNAVDAYGLTALHYAIPRGIAGIDSVSIVFRPFHELPPNMPRLVKALLAHGANPNAAIAKDFPPYSRSPYALQTSLVGVTPFLLAAAAADVDLMHTLLTAGADPQIKAKDGATALMLAAGVGRIDERENEQEEASAVEATRRALMP